MQPGTFELLILVFIFLGLQAWWIIPIVIKNNINIIKIEKLMLFILFPIL